ncbi:hypothetical protein MOKP104_16260 [Mycobacterium avium subsp. hominissuis]|jgi:hypothetical protein
MFVAEDSHTARDRAVNSQLSYLQSNVFRYHDTFPRPQGFPGVAGAACRPARRSISSPKMVQISCGDPDQALQQCQRWASAGADQLTFATAAVGTQDDTLDTIRLLGEYVIPNDRHRTHPQHNAIPQQRCKSGDDGPLISQMSLSSGARRCPVWTIYG